MAYVATGNWAEKCPAERSIEPGVGTLAGSGPGAGLPQQPYHLTLVGVPLQRLLGKHPAAVHLDFEHAAGGLDELDLGVREGLADLGRQTGSPWLVVSNDAEFDRDSHASRISTLDTPRHTSDLAR
jgi:hypothetical protein